MNGSCKRLNPLFSCPSELQHFPIQTVPWTLRGEGREQQQQRDIPQSPTTFNSFCLEPGALSLPLILRKWGWSRDRRGTRSPSLPWKSGNQQKWEEALAAPAAWEAPWQQQDEKWISVFHTKPSVGRKSWARSLFPTALTAKDATASIPLLLSSWLCPRHPRQHVAVIFKLENKAAVLTLHQAMEGPAPPHYR